jgi:hypothetical protein
MFMGCVDAEAGPEGEETTLFDLQEVIGDLDAGYIDDWGSVFDNTPFQKCGSPDVQIIVDGGKKKLKIDNMQNGWGEGVDLYNNSDAGKKIVGVGFKAGDEVYIKGTINPVGNGLKITNGGGKPRFGDGWLGDASFDQTITLKAADIADIKGANPNAVRISYSDPDGDARKGTIIIEELTVKGLRKAGEGAEPPMSYAIDGSGKYKVPASSGLAIYLDLNEAIHSQLTPGPLPAGFPAAKIEGPDPAVTADKTGKLTIPFTVAAQAVFIKFTPEVKDLIVSAAFAGYKFNVTIDGSAVPVAGEVRWCLGADRTGGWNLSTPLTQATFESQKTNILHTLSGAAGDLDGIVFQARTALPFTVVMNSIKVELVPPAGALTVLTTTNAISIGKPGTGRVADKSVDGTGFTGLVTWYPELPRSGRFEALKEYRAEIAIFPKAGFTTSATTDFQVSYTGTGTGTIAKVYNAATRVVSTVNFEYTKAINELLLGDIWKLSDWFKADTKELSDPLMQAGGPTYAFDTSAKKITISNVQNSWDSVDIVLPKVDAGADPALWKISIVISGKVLTLKNGVSTGTMIAGGAAGAYAWLANQGSLGEGDTFTLSTGEIAAGYIPANSAAVRIQGQDGNVTSYEITEIVISNAGPR